jgi:hypothetical protein
MELIVISLGGSLMALCLQLSGFIRRRTAGRAGVWRQPTQAVCKTFFLVAATALLYALSPVRAIGSGLGDRPEATPAVSLSQSPLVMRMGKDEFRLAFGINSVGCTRSGCYGAIRYRVSWKAEDGTTRSDIREVGYTVLPHDARSITFDRQYFDTAEGAHTTDVVEVTVARITCHRGTESGAFSASRTPRAQLYGNGYRGAAEDHSEVVPVPQQQ